MANKSLFASAVAKLLPATDRVNRAGGIAYGYGSEHLLAQLAATGTMSDGFYGSGAQQLAMVLDAAQQCDPHFVAQAALYARQAGKMKDMPALLAAFLTRADPDLAVRIFPRVIDNGRMLRNFVQIMRSGQAGRTSLGTRPKRLVQKWLEQASMRQLMQAATGNAPSLADVVKMVHPRPADESRRAFYGWLLGRPYDLAALPAEIADFEAWKRDQTRPLPDVPFEWLTAFPLTAENWAVLATRMGWQALRMNLNTLARNGAFAVAGVTEQVAARLEDADTIAHAHVLPYQLMVALGQVGEGVPLRVQAALETALDLALVQVPALPGQVVVCPDVSGSMGSPVTGYRKGATSTVRCIDVAALVAAAVLRSNRQARVMPFEVDVVPLELDPFARVAVNAARLAAVDGGGTNVSAPLAQLNREKAAPDLVIIVSDNQSWIDSHHHDATQVMKEWKWLKQRNRNARLVCIDIQPYGTSQAPDRPEIMNIGGFSDDVFETIARFVGIGGQDQQSWVDRVKQMEV